MERREFITALGGAAAGPTVARAQHAMPATEIFNVASFSNVALFSNVPSPNGYAATSVAFRASPSDHPRAGNDAPREPRGLS